MSDRAYHRDLGLSVRMILSGGLLLVLYAPFVVGAVYYLAFLFGADEWVALALGAGAVFGVVPLFSAKVVLASAGARMLAEEEAPELYDMLARLAGLADLPRPKLALMATDVPNAFATGRNPENGVIVVTTGLLARLERSEVEAVLAHELSHIATRDAPLMTALGLPTIAARRVLRWWVRTPLLLVFFCWLLFLGWVAYAMATLLLMTISRYRELVADRGAALITGAPEQLMSALQRIAGEMARIPERDLREVAGMNAFFIVPAAQTADGFEIDPLRLFPTHPPLSGRLERLADLARGLGRTVPPEPTKPLLPPPERPSNGLPPIAFVFALMSWALPAYWLLEAVRIPDQLPSPTPLLLAPLAWSLGIFSALQGLGRAQRGGRGAAVAIAALVVLLAPLAVGFLFFPLLLVALALGT
jgi:heat shock protein HtpX